MERYYQSSRAFYLPTTVREDMNGFELALGKRHYLFSNNETPFNNSSSAQIAVDKYATNKILEAAGIPVPRAIALHVSEFQSDRVEPKIDRLNFPVVIKPLTGSLGLDVLCNIQTRDELIRWLPNYFSTYDKVIIEEFHAQLKSYRVLVFNRKVIGVVFCQPASVIGDGQHTLQELIDLTNSKRAARGDPGVGPIVVDEECRIRLKELGLGLDYIPRQEETIVLCYTSNGTRGGTFESLTQPICKENRQLMIRVADVLNLNLTGIDLECYDIMKPLKGTHGVVLEVNHRPCVRIHELPFSGEPIVVSKRILRSLIARHPLSYLYSLYSNRPTALYIRSAMVTAVLGLLFELVPW